MRILSVEMSNFRGIQSARVELGPRLNVLHGPNEAGKSTFVAAVRAALLLPYSSSAGEEYVTWGTDLVPKVILTFEINGTTYRITKAFASGSNGTAILARMKGAEAFEEARGRAVDGKLRQLLAWGIPEPGGRGAPRGLPESYLTHALLGEQDDVTSILEESIEEDRTDTGKSLLTEALGVLGQDPLVSRIIDLLEERTARVFTATGQLKRSQDSPLTSKSREIAQHEAQIRSLEQDCQRSVDVERQVSDLTEAAAAAEEERAVLESQVNRAKEAAAAEERIAQYERQQAELKNTEEAHRACEDTAEKADLAFREAKSTHAELAKQLHAAQTRLASANTSRERLQESIERSRVERSQSARARISVLENQIATVESVLAAEVEVAKHELECEHARRSYQAAEQATAQAEKQLAYSRLNERRQLILERQRVAAEAERELAEAVADVDRLEAQLEVIADRLQAAKEFAAARQQMDRIAENDTLVESKRAQLAAHEQKLGEHLQQVTAANEQVKLLETQVEAARNRLAKLQGERDTRRESTASLKQSRLENLTARRESLQQRIAQIQTVIDAEQDAAIESRRLDELKNELASAKAAVEQSKLVARHASLMQAKSQAESAAAVFQAAHCELDEAGREVAQAEINVQQAKTECHRAREHRDGLQKTLHAIGVAAAKSRSLEADRKRLESDKAKATAYVKRLKYVSELGAEFKQHQHDLQNTVAELKRVDADFDALNKGVAKQHATLTRQRVIAYGNIFATAVSGGLALFLQQPVLFGSVAGVFAVLGIAILLLSIKSNRQLAVSKQTLADNEQARRTLTQQRAQFQAQARAVRSRYESIINSLPRQPRELWTLVQGRFADTERKLCELQEQCRVCDAELANYPKLTPADVEEANQAVRCLEERTAALDEVLADARQRLATAQFRMNSANPDSLEELARLDSELTDVGQPLDSDERAVDSASAHQQLELNQQKVRSLESDIRVADQGLAESRKRLEHLKVHLDGPAEDVLTAAQQDLAQITTRIGEVDEDIDRELREADAAVDAANRELAPLAKQLEETELGVFMATKALHQAQAARDITQGELDQLSQAMPEHVCSAVRDELSDASQRFTVVNGPHEVSAEALSAIVESLPNESRQTETQLRAARERFSIAKSNLQRLQAEAAEIDAQTIEHQLTEMSADDGLSLISAEEACARLTTVAQDRQSAKTALEVATKSHQEAVTRWTSAQEPFDEPLTSVLERATRERDELAGALANLDDALEQELAQARTLVEKEERETERLANEVARAAKVLDEASQRREEAQAQASRSHGILSELQRAVNYDELEHSRQVVVAAWETLRGVLTPKVAISAQLKNLEASLKQAVEFAKVKQRELQMARGKLNLIGGAVAKDRLGRARETLDRISQEAYELEEECKAEQYLLQVLTETSEEHAAHLGRSLAEPVSRSFLDLTGGRYEGFTIEPGLSLKTVEAAGGEREPTSLSVGTRHQLAVLIRLALAAHLKSALLLDDQLVHSDLNRLGWFRERIRASVSQHEFQVIVVTCRPHDYIDEGTTGNDGVFDSEPVKVIDLSKHILRH